jgi:hypothetical protein
MVGEITNLPNRLKTKGNENRLNLRKALCAPSVTSATAKKALDALSIGAQIKPG